MKVLLHFCTSIGPRTVVAEIGDPDTAQAIVNAHLAAGEQAVVVEEMPRLSMKAIMTKLKREQAKAKVATAKASQLPENVTPIKSGKRANG